jgi:hypothetical protein
MWRDRVEGGSARFKDVFEISLAHGRVIRAADLCHAFLSGLGGPWVMPDETEGFLIFQHDL